MKKFLFAVLLLSLTMAQAQSGFYASIGGALSSMAMQNSDVINISYVGPAKNTQYQPAATSGLFFYHLAGGYEFSLSRQWQLQTGLSAYQYQGSPTGNIVLGDNNNGTYSYHLTSTTILLDSHLLYYPWTKIAAFLHLGLGATQLSTSNYQNFLAVSGDAAAQFPGASKINNSYLAGAGVNAAINSRWSLGLEGDVLNIGKVDLGQASLANQSKTQDLNFGIATVSSVLLFVSYHF